MFRIEQYLLGPFHDRVVFETLADFAFLVIVPFDDFECKLFGDFFPEVGEVVVEIMRQFFRQRVYFYVYIGEIPFKFGPLAQLIENFLGTAVISEAFVFDIIFKFVVYFIGNNEFFGVYCVAKRNVYISFTK